MTLKTIIPVFAALALLAPIPSQAYDYGAGDAEVRRRNQQYEYENDMRNMRREMEYQEHRMEMRQRNPELYGY